MSAQQIFLSDCILRVSKPSCVYCELLDIVRGNSLQHGLLALCHSPWQKQLNVLLVQYVRCQVPCPIAMLSNLSAETHMYEIYVLSYSCVDLLSRTVGQLNQMFFKQLSWVWMRLKPIHRHLRQPNKPTLRRHLWLFTKNRLKLVSWKTQKDIIPQKAQSFCRRTRSLNIWKRQVHYT